MLQRKFPASAEPLNVFGKSLRLLAGEKRSVLPVAGRLGVLTATAPPRVKERCKMACWPAVSAEWEGACSSC